MLGGGFVGGWGGGGGRGNLPGLRDDDVVEGGVAFAEAGEADFDNHCWLSTDVERKRERKGVWRLSFAASLVGLKFRAISLDVLYPALANCSCETAILCYDRLLGIKEIYTV